MKQLFQALMMVRRADRAAFRLRILYVMLQSLLPLLNLYILKLLIDSVTQCIQAGLDNCWQPSFYCLLAMCAVFLLNRVISALSGINNDILTQRVTDYMSDIVQRQAASIDLACYDQPAYHDLFHRAQQETVSRPLQILDSFMALFGAVLSIAGVTAMLLTAAWWIVVVMIVAVLPSFAVRMYKARCLYAFRRDNTQLYRRTAYYGQLLTGRASAAEMRAFRLVSYFRRLFVDVRSVLSSRLLAISRRLGAMDVACSVFETVAMFAVVGLLVREAFTGLLTIGAFVMLFEAFRRGQGYMTALVNATAKLYDNRLFVSNLFEFLNLKPGLTPIPSPFGEGSEMSASKVSTPLSFGEGPGVRSIEFRDITFRYPGMDHDVLEHYNLTARVGEICRIDGRNGYGKSTLVKLLLRLYDPREGAILADGVDIRTFDPDEWRSHVAVVFQDFVRYACTLDENLAFGNTESSGRTPHSALIRDIVARLPHGEKTMLGRVFDGGEELSMGQWQRIAIARALSSDAPILIMDEPLAWLDADAREQFNAALTEVVPNRIVILISHL